MPVVFYDERFTSALAHKAMLDGGLTQAALGAHDALAVEHFHLGIDERQPAAGAFRETFAHRVGVYHHDAFAQPHLRSRQPHAFRGIHRRIHVFEEFFQAFAPGRHRFGGLAQHGVAVEIYG